MSGPRIRDNPFDCPKCGGRMQCVDTRPSRFRGKHSVHRRRSCVKCGSKISTTEVESSVLDQATALAVLTAEVAAAETKLDAALEAVQRYVSSQPSNGHDGQNDLAGAHDELLAAGLPGWEPK